MPRAPTDYVHRVGRTARAGRRGRAISLVTQHDVELVHAVEEHTGVKLGLVPDITDEEVVPLLNPVAKGGPTDPFHMNPAMHVELNPISPCWHSLTLLLEPASPYHLNSHEGCAATAP